MTNAQVIPKLQEVKTQIPGTKAKGVPHRQSVEFSAWQEKVTLYLNQESLKNSWLRYKVT